MSIARRERFLHWEAAFPGVWRGWQDYRPEGGFDAVIGNPPWDPHRSCKKSSGSPLRDDGAGARSDRRRAKGAASSN